MVVLMEAESGCGGVTLKRKGEEQPDFFVFPGDVDGACRATKMRRLDALAADDVAMGDAAAPSTAEVGAEGEGAMVVYDQAESVAGGVGLLSQLRRLRPWAAALRAGGKWIRDMLREADSRPVRRLLSGAEEDGTGDLVLVPWGSSPAPAAAAGYLMADDAGGVAEEEEEGGEGSTATAMEVEEERGDLARSLAGAGAGCGEGYYFRRWPRQHCMAPPQMTAMIGQATPVMTWSW